MISVEQLIEAFGRNASIIQMQAKDLTHGDSLLQPPFRGNCLNWVIGHIAGNRDVILAALGAGPVLGDARARYQRESEPVREDDPDVLPLETLLAKVTASQEALAAALSRTTEADWTKELRFGQRVMTVAQRVFFLYFHETYHVGQTELLRQLAGKNDKVI